VTATAISGVSLLDIGLLKGERARGREGKRGNKMRNLESKGVRNWFAVLLLCVLIFLPSLIHLPMPRGPVNDKVAHLLVYFVVGFLVLRGARSLPLGQSRFAAVCFAFLVAVTIGMADEVHQFFVPRRSMDRMDFLCDIVGVVCGICIYLIVWAREERKRHDRSRTDGS